MLKNALRVLALCSTLCSAAMLAACAGGGEIPHVDAYNDVPYGNFFYGDTVPDKVYFKAQDDVVAPHCKTFAYETSPSTGKAAKAFGVNHGVGGFIGGVAGIEAEGAIVGGPVTGPYALGTGVWNGINTGIQGSMSGAEMVDQQRHAKAQWCLMGNTGGYHVVNAQERKEIDTLGYSPTLQKLIEADPISGKPVSGPPPTP